MDTILATTAVLTVIGALLSLVLVFAVHFLFIYFRELGSKDHRPPVAGSIFNLLIHFNYVFDYQTSLARKYNTFRLILSSHSEIYTVDPVNIEYILKTNFPNYGKGQYNIDVMRDLFGDGIFAVDGDKWRHQRKLASYEFSTKVLREFSTSVFRTSAARLVSEVFCSVGAKKVIDLQNLESCSYKVVIKTSCSSVTLTRDQISIAFGDAYGNQVYGPRIDDPATKAFERCSSDTYQITGPCTYQLCYVYLYRSGIDGWTPESVQIYSSTTKPVSFFYNTNIPNEVWYGFNLCNSPPSSSGTQIFTNIIVHGLILSALLFLCV